jgi:hypothetical protein
MKNLIKTLPRINADARGSRTIAKSAGIAKIETNTFETQRKRRKNLCVADLRGYA